MSNLFEKIPATLPDELVQTLAAGDGLRIERIVSTGHASPPGFWYEQEESEWVVVLRGEAKLVFEREPEAVHLKAGDYVNIPARAKHRVEWTSPDEPTVWLAVFYRSSFRCAVDDSR